MSERRSPRYHETCLALESVKESSAAVNKPRGVWLRMPIVKNLEEARRLAQQLAGGSMLMMITTIFAGD